MKAWKVALILTITAGLGLLFASDWTPAATDGVYDIQRKTLSGVNHLTTNHNAVSVTNGTELASFNLLRTSDHTTGCVPYYDSTYDTSGTNIVNMLIGGSGTGVPVGGIGHDRLEWFLMGSVCTNYVIVVTPIADDDKVSIEMTWKEDAGT